MRDERCRPGAHYGCECDDAEIAALRAEMNAAIEAAHDRAIRLDHAEAEAKRRGDALVQYAAQLVMLYPQIFREDGPEFVRRDSVISIAMDLKKAAAALSEKREARGEGDK